MWGFTCNESDASLLAADTISYLTSISDHTGFTKNLQLLAKTGSLDSFSPKGGWAEDCVNFYKSPLRRLQGLFCLCYSIKILIYSCYKWCFCGVPILTIL